MKQKSAFPSQIYNSAYMATNTLLFVGGIQVYGIKVIAIF